MTDGELNLSTGLSLIVTEPSPLHIEWVKTLAKALDAHLDETRLCFSGPGIQIPQKKGPDNARDPDLVVCTAQQWSLVKRQTKALFLKGNAPLIAIEIVSPSSVKKDTEELIQEYAIAGVSEYWSVNPILETVTVYVLAGKRYALKGKYRGSQQVESDVLNQWSATAAAMLG